MKSFCLVLIFTIGVFFHGEALGAPCPNPTFTNDESVRILDDTILIATHPSTLWDGRFSSKAGMDAAVAFAKKKGLAVTYLQGYSNSHTYFFGDCHPDYYVRSSGGEFYFDISHVDHVYSVGGHWELCQSTTLKYILGQWASREDTDLKITQVMDGIYLHGQDVRKSDPYYDNFNLFMEILTYKNPRERWYVRKLNLLEMMGIIGDEKEQVEFLKRQLPNYSGMTHHSVELHLNGHPVELLKDSGTSYTLVLDFVDSLYASGKISAPR